MMKKGKWIENTGDLPVNINDMVQVEFANGYRLKSPVRTFNWTPVGGSTDIVRYRKLYPWIKNTGTSPEIQEGMKLVIKFRGGLKIEPYNSEFDWKLQERQFDIVKYRWEEYED
jgi:hypothetical protein